MSYVVIRVYSFECDRDGCEEIAEVTPWNNTGKRGAVKELNRHEYGWDADEKHQYCPEHPRSQPKRLLVPKGPPRNPSECTAPIFEDEDGGAHEDFECDDPGCMCHEVVTEETRDE